MPEMLVIWTHFDYETYLSAYVLTDSFFKALNLMLSTCPGIIHIKSQIFFHAVES